MSQIYSVLLKLCSTTPVYAESKAKGFNLSFQYWRVGGVMQLSAWLLVILCFLYFGYPQYSVFVIALCSLPVIALSLYEHYRLKTLIGLGFDGRFFLILKPNIKFYVELQGEVFVSGFVIALLFKCERYRWPLLINSATVSDKDFHFLRQFFICTQSSTEMTKS